MSLEAVLITSVIDANEEQDVDIVNVPGAFMKANQDKVINITLRGKLAELMVKTTPEFYRRYVVTEKVKMVLYVQLLKSLYGCLHIALLFYKKLLADLESRGFELKPYDPCVVNNTINVKQLTITWHVDYLKLSHVDTGVVDKMIEWMNGLYGNGMLISRGKKHDYLGMNLDFSVKGQVAVNMVDYLKGVISDFEEVQVLTVTESSPAAEHLYRIREECNQTKLDDKRGTVFHHAVAQLLFICPRSRKDIQTAVSFLVTRFWDTDEDNWVKLKCLLRYVRRTINLPLLLRADSLTITK